MRNKTTSLPCPHTVGNKVLDTVVKEAAKVFESTIVDLDITCPTAKDHLRLVELSNPSTLVYKVLDSLELDTADYMTMLAPPILQSALDWIATVSRVVETLQVWNDYGLKRSGPIRLKLGIDPSVKYTPAWFTLTNDTEINGSPIHMAVALAEDRSHAIFTVRMWGFTDNCLRFHMGTERTGDPE